MLKMREKIKGNDANAWYQESIAEAISRSRAKAVLLKERRLWSAL
jgi:hypothetical protein